MLAITADQVIVGAAIAQAGATLFIFWLTRGLVNATREYVAETQELAVATSQYVSETQTLALEAKHTNEMAERNTERLLRQR